MGEPVSWLMIERGWKVAASDGSEAGRVEAVVGDETTDIFDGLAISAGAFQEPRYLPADSVAAITDGWVELDLSPAQVERLDPYEPPAESKQVRPD